MSLFSSTYQWSISAGPAGATLSNATSLQPTFTALTSGTYVVQLVTGNGSTLSSPTSLTIVVDSALSYDPVSLRFNDIKALIQTSGSGNCMRCHQTGGNGTAIPAIWFNDYDRDGSAGAPDATDDHWFYTELRGRINFTDVIASPLLRKPSGNHHSGDRRIGFDTRVAPGQVERQDYDKILGWILNGAPE
jgi:hypothetical protein